MLKLNVKRRKCYFKRICILKSGCYAERPSNICYTIIETYTHSSAMSKTFAHGTGAKSGSLRRCFLYFSNIKLTYIATQQSRATKYSKKNEST